MLKPLTVCITTNCGKLFKRWEYQTTSLPYREICKQVKKQQVELDMEQWAGSKLGKKYIKVVYCHPASFQFSRSVMFHSTASWTAAHQTSQSITNSSSLLKLMSIESMIPSNHLILYVVPFSSCLQSFPASRSFPMCQFFTSGGQSFGASASALLLPMNIQG